MATESGTTTSSTVRIAPRPVVMFVWPAFCLLVMLAVTAAALSLPPDQRHMGITPIVCLTIAPAPAAQLPDHSCGRPPAGKRGTGRDG